MFDKSHYNILQDYLASGCNIQLTDEEREYYNALLTMVNIHRKYGKENAIAFLMHAPFNCSRLKATAMYGEAVNLFYLNENIEREAHRNMIFDNLQKAALVVLQNAVSSEDFEVYGRLLTQAAKIKGLDRPDPDKPKEITDKPIVVFDLRSEAVGLPSADRNRLAAQIDSLMDIPHRERTRLKRDAGIEEVDIEDILDDQEEKTQGY